MKDAAAAVYFSVYSRRPLLAPGFLISANTLVFIWMLDQVTLQIFRVLKPFWLMYRG